MSTVPDDIRRLVGQFDEHADAYRRGDYNETQVRRDFMRKIESWRDALARNLSLRNRRLSDRELNFAVQRLIDRIVFLRMCEGRGIEPFGSFSLAVACEPPSRDYSCRVGRGRVNPWWDCASHA